MPLGSLNQEGEILVHRHMQAAPEPVLTAIAPYREDLVVCVEGLCPWDLARRPLRPGGDPLRPGPGPLEEGNPRRQGPT
jgi:hypothetical protein